MKLETAKKKAWKTIEGSNEYCTDKIYEHYLSWRKADLARGSELKRARRNFKKQGWVLFKGLLFIKSDQLLLFD